MNNKVNVDRSPWEGVKVTNLVNNKVLTNETELEQFFGEINNTSAQFSSTQIDDAIYDKSARLAVDWNDANVDAAAKIGRITWNTTGLSLQSELKAAYDLQFQPVWNKPVAVSKGLTITVQPGSN